MLLVPVLISHLQGYLAHEEMAFSCERGTPVGNGSTIALRKCGSDAGAEGL